MKKIKLNLGCGHDKKIGWINIDALPSLKPDLVHNLLRPLPFADQTVDEILAQDILEHFTAQDANKLITEVSRVLKINGRLTVRVPDIDQIIKQFHQTPEVRNLFIYGDTSESGVFGAHKNGFTPKSLLYVMCLHQLRPIKISREETNLVANFQRQNRKQQPIAGVIIDDISKSSLKKVLLNQVILLEKIWPKLLLSPIIWMLNKPIMWLEGNDLSNDFKKFGIIKKILYRLEKSLPSLIIFPQRKILNNYLTNTRVDLEKVRVYGKSEQKQNWQKLLQEAKLRQSVSCWLNSNYQKF